MRQKIWLSLVLTMVAGAWGCTVNVENTYRGATPPDATAGQDASSEPDSSSPKDTGNDEDAAAPDTSDRDTGPDADGGANDQYPCMDDPSIPKERCQASAAWDEYEDQAMVERGAYLTRNVAICADCHTPFNPEFITGMSDCPPSWGPRDCDLPMAGDNLPLHDYAPANPELGAVRGPNLTPHPDGLGEWSPEEVRRAFTEGVRSEDKSDYPIMFPVMPYYFYNRFSKQDQDSILAYLHSLTPYPDGEAPPPPIPGVPEGAGTGPTRQPQPAGSVWAVFDTATPIDYDGDGQKEGLRPPDDDFMPAIQLSKSDPDYQTAKHGKYLAEVACAFCHTPAYPPDGSLSGEELFKSYMYYDRDSALIGDVGQDAVLDSSWFPESVFFGPEYSGRIRTQNLTGDPATGIGNWTIEELIKAVNGIDRENEPMCPPMPVNTYFEPMKPDDKRALAVYLKNSAPSTNDTSTPEFNCKVPD